MTESDNIKEVVNQVAMQAVVAVMMALRDMEGGSQMTTAVTHREPQGQRHSGPMLMKPAFSWGVQDRYIGLMNFKMDVSNILETKVYELS